MKNTALIISIFALAITGAFAQESLKPGAVKHFEGSVLDFYKEYSYFTDPGEYTYLYESLPDSLPELCKLIRSQFIHPFAELPRYRDVIPQERRNDMYKYPTVKDVLEGLLSYDSSGIVLNKEPKNHLVLGCRHNALLLASILKSRGIPVRLRAGHATYLIPNFHTSHVICEVWNEVENRWMLVDASMEKVDFSRDEFDISNEAWFQLQNKEIDPDQFGIPGVYTGMVSIMAKVYGDLAFILGSEFPTYQYSPALEYVFDNKNNLPEKHIDLLNKISTLMNSLDADNLAQLQEIYNNNSEIQLTKSFLDKMKSETAHK